MIMYVVAVAVETKKTFRFAPFACIQWFLVAHFRQTVGSNVAVKELVGAICIHRTYGTVADTYPTQSGCTTRSTSSPRRRRRRAERGGRGPPPAARSNSPWSRTGRRPPPPCSPPTKQTMMSIWLIAFPGNVDKCKFYYKSNDEDKLSCQWIRPQGECF